MKSFILFLGLILTGLTQSSAQSAEKDAAPAAACCENGSCCKGNNPAPAGIMTDHIHAKGQWMVSYGFMDMSMKGMQSGSTKMNNDAVYKTYMMSPRQMDMQMHMVMVMYGVTDRFTLMAMGGFNQNSMSMDMNPAMANMPGMHMDMGNMTMSMSSSGLADSRLTGLYNFSNNQNRRIIGTLGLLVPTGSTQLTGTTMLGDNQRLPYNMQTGTGSWGIAPGFTVVQQHGKCSIGLEVGGELPLNRNATGYKTGNVYHASVWGAHQFLSFLSGSVRASYTSVGALTGSDAAINIPYNTANDPTANTANYGGRTAQVFAGANVRIPKAYFRKFDLLLEYGIPVYQNLNGTQMSQHGTLVTGLQFAF